MRQAVTKTLRETAPCGSRRHLGESRTPAVRSGHRLCDTCVDGVETMLDDLPEVYARSAHELDAARHQLAERVSRTREHGIRLREDVVQVRSAIIDTLSSWCALVVAQRGVRAPQRPSIAPLTGFLATHMQWLTASEGAVEFADDMLELGSAIHEVMEPEPAAPASLGPCPWPGCDEQLHASAGASTGVMARQISCAAGHRWPPEQWLTLNRELAFTQKRDEQNPADGVEKEIT